MNDPVSRIIDRKERRGLRTIIGLIIIVVIIVIIGRESTPNRQDAPAASQSLTSSDPKIEAYISQATRMLSVKLEKLSWRKDAFDTIMTVNFTLVNTNAFDIKDVEITCEAFANSGTRIDRNVRTVYETIKAKQSKTMRNFNMGFIHSQVSKTSCSVTDFRPQ